MSSKKSNNKIMACFDTETTNDNKNRKAFAICYQLSVLNNRYIEGNEITNDNVNSCLEITIDRHFKDVCKRFDELIEYGIAEGITPVVMVHNLSFEMWILSSYINKYETKSCAKSCVKPLTITLCEHGNPVLIFWDTLSFYGKSLEKLGDECGYPKLVGDWDYTKYRTPDTELTEQEIEYAKQDVIVPWAYLGYYLRLNPEIEENELAHKVITKTSAVRYKSQKRCGNIKLGNSRATTGYTWLSNNRSQKPKTDEELEYIHAANRGGFTYIAREYASKVFHKENGYHIYKYDANSMHISQALSHFVPKDYRWKQGSLILKLFYLVGEKDYKYVLEHYDDPFASGKFIAMFKFTNVRLKKGSVFERDGISSFAWSKFKIINNTDLTEDNEGGVAFDLALAEKGYHDYSFGDVSRAYGKFYGASECIIILNELTAWEFWQEFDFDTVEVYKDKGLFTGRGDYATDKSVLSFNEFYKAKTEFKRLKGNYERILNGETSENISMDSISNSIPNYLLDKMSYGAEEIENDVNSYYLSVKGELNSLYGMEATNEAKNDIILTDKGFKVGEYKGVEGLPNNPKAWYQYGSHIVGYSRIHQILFMLLLQDKVEAFICGDTDSHKIYTRYSSNDIENALEPLHIAADKALEKCTAKARKIKEWYPMDGLGHYECEGECESFMAAWNKSYIQLIHNRIILTIAGIPCSYKHKLSTGEVVDKSYNTLANTLYERGWKFDKIAETLLGYNVTISHNITGLNERVIPKWADIDECGEPRALWLYSLNKTIGDTSSKENYINMQYAELNNENINTSKIMIDWDTDIQIWDTEL